MPGLTTLLLAQFTHTCSTATARFKHLRDHSQVLIGTTQLLSLTWYCHILLLVAARDEFSNNCDFGCWIKNTISVVCVEAHVPMLAARNGVSRSSQTLLAHHSLTTATPYLDTLQVSWSCLKCAFNYMLHQISEGSEKVMEIWSAIPIGHIMHSKNLVGI